MPQINPQEMKSRIMQIRKRRDLPDKTDFFKLLSQVMHVYKNEDPAIRPKDKNGFSGGLINLKNRETILIPDLHARYNFLLSLFFWESSPGNTVLDRLASDDIQVLSVGDIFHSEGHQRNRWKAALKEFSDGYKKAENMKAEMVDCFNTIEMIILAKLAFPDNFHIIKGNHENIANERGNGNFPFGKYAYEGQMVLDFVIKFLGEDFLRAYYQYEKEFPVFVTGPNFLVSHSEPEKFFTREEMINYRDNQELIKGLTWTDNGKSEPGTVRKMLDYYLPGIENSFYFGGHRPVPDSYNLRAEGKYVQFHNPSHYNIVRIKGDINLDRDIFEIPAY